MTDFGNKLFDSEPPFQEIHQQGIRPLNEIIVDGLSTNQAKSIEKRAEDLELELEAEKVDNELKQSIKSIDQRLSALIGQTNRVFGTIIAKNTSSPVISPSR